MPWPLFYEVGTAPVERERGRLGSGRGGCHNGGVYLPFRIGGIRALFGGIPNLCQIVHLLLYTPEMGFLRQNDTNPRYDLWHKLCE